MNHLNQSGLLAAYNSLTDKHLTGYFNNTRIRRHLQRVGLISRSGRIVPDKEYRHKLIQRAHQRHVRECLAQAIFHKVLEMERVHQIEIKRKLEEFTRRERVHKIKLDRSKRYEEEAIRILSPRPPTGPRSGRRQHSGPEGEHTESSESPGSSRPNTAPGKMQRPVRLKPIHSNSTTASRRRGSPYRRHDSSNETDADHTFSYTMDKEPQRHRTVTDLSRGISPYCLPVINNFVTPVPPPTKRKERGLRASGTLRGRRLRPTTAPHAPEESPMLRTSVHQSQVCVNMVYFGKTVHLSHDLMDFRDEVKVFQQHCGGENLCVYKGKLREGDTFQFISRRHRGFPFSLTFFLNGLQVERLSSCCEFKHKKGSRLGGRHGHFGFTAVEGASPCYKCIIAMGLDKKPTPPPKRIREDRGLPSPEDRATQHTPEMDKESEIPPKDTAVHTEPEPASQPRDTESKIEEDLPPEEDKARDDYEEDFEADDEGPAEDCEVKEEKISPARERDASDVEEDKKEGDRRSRSASSSSGSDREDSETEAHNKGAQTAEQPKEPEGDAPEVYQEEAPAVPPAEEKDEHPAAPDTRAAQKDSPVPPLTIGSPRAKESGSEGSPGESTELEVSDTTSAPLANGGKVDNNTVGAVEQGKEADKLIDEHTEEQEPERAKSVQEKVAEAILKEAQCSSEPELSDTTTEEEEESTEKRQQRDNNDAVPEKVVNCEASPVAVTSEPAEDNKENTEEKELSEDSEKKTVDDKTSEPQSHNEEKPTDTEIDEEKKEGEEKVTETECTKEDESPPSEQENKAEETTAQDKTEVVEVATIESTEMKPEPQEDLTCEETPVADAEKQGDGEAGPGGPSEGSGDATVQAKKSADTTEVKAEDEVLTEDGKEQAPEEALGAEANKEESVKDNQTSEKAEEESEKSIKENVEDTEVTDSKESAPEFEDKTMNEKNNNTVNNLIDKSDEEKEKSSAPSDSKIEKYTNSEANASTNDAPSAVDGDTGADTEEASKPSEEGASVVLKPQAESAQLTHKSADQPKESALGKEGDVPEKTAKTEGNNVTPESLEIEDSRNLVTNWVTLHQTGKLFQKFSDPIEVESANTTVLQRSSSPVQMLTMDEHKVGDEINSESVEKEPEPTANDGSESKDNTQVEDLHSDQKSNHSKDDAPSESQPTEDALQVKEESGVTVTQQAPITETDNDEEPVNKEMTANHGSESKDSPKVEDLHSDLKSNHSKDDAPSESQPTEDAPQVKVESGVTQQASITETDNDEEPVNKEMSTEEHNKRSGPFEGEKHQEPVANDGSESKDNTKVEDLDSDQKSNHSKDDVPNESQPTEDALQVKEESGVTVTQQVPITETDNDEEPVNKEMSTEEHNEKSGPFEGEKHQEPAANDGSESKDNTKVEDLSDQKSNHYKDDVPSESQPTEDALQVKEESGVTQQAPITETDNNEEPVNKEMSTEEHNEKSGPFEGEKHQEPAANHGSESKDSTKVEDLHSDLKSNHSKDNAPSESQPTEDALQVKEESGVTVTQQAPITETDNDEEPVNKEMSTEEHNEKSGLLEGEKHQEPAANDGNESKDNTKVEDLHSDLKSNHSKDGAPSESQPTEDALQVKDESGVTVTQQAPITEMDNDEEPVNKEMTANHGSESKDSTKVEDLHSDLKSNHSKDDAPSESQPTEVAPQVKEETGVTQLVPITESENDGEDATRGANKEMSTEEHKETSELFEGGKDQDATAQRDTEQSDVCKTEMESVTNQSAASVKSDHGPENQREEEMNQDDPGLNAKQTMIEEIKIAPSPPISEGHQENSESPEKLDPSGITATGEPEDTDNGDKKEEESTELTEVSDLTLTSKSEEGSQDDSHTGQTQTKQTEGSINGDNKTVQLIEDKKDLNKDPCTLSVEETFPLGHITHTLLTTTRT